MNIEKSRKLDINHLLRKSFLKKGKHDQIVIVVGNSDYSESETNNICVMYCTKGNSGDNTVSIETNNPSLLGLSEQVGLTFIDSGVDFVDMQMSNMDGTAVDLDQPKSNLKFTINLN